MSDKKSLSRKKRKYLIVFLLVEIGPNIKDFTGGCCNDCEFLKGRYFDEIYTCESFCSYISY